MTQFRYDYDLLTWMPSASTVAFCRERLVISAQLDHGGAGIGVGLGMLSPERRRDSLELRAALVDRHARAEPRDRPQEQVGPIFVIARLEGEERPELRVAIREVKARRHHADDDVRGLVERDGASEDVGVGAEDALPERLAQNEWPRAAGVGGQESPAEHGCTPSVWKKSAVAKMPSSRSG